MAVPQRRLSAILHADLSGFVRMTEGEEDLTYEHLKAARSEVWRPAIESSGGFLVHGNGDSMLIEFASVLAAVAAAIDIQERMARFNEVLVEDQKLMFRIGVHVGEVIYDEESHDLFGDGVNLAERIQVMAEPGGVAVSRAVRDVTELQVDYAFVDGGEHRAKHVSRPIHIFHVRPRLGASTRTTTAVAPHATLRFHGTDPAGRRVGFDLAFEKLMGRKREGFVIGRDVEHSDAVLSHPTVSRRHARLFFSDNSLQIEDLDSTNGTSVDGTLLTPGAPQPLQAGAQVRIGDIELAFRYS
jgi:class 3 adenylate cyclase